MQLTNTVAQPTMVYMYTDDKIEARPMFSGKCVRSRAKKPAKKYVLHLLKLKKTHQSTEDTAQQDVLRVCPVSNHQEIIEAQLKTLFA